MSLANGRQFVSIPGPSVTPDRVLRAMMRPSPNIYAGELVEITGEIFPRLREVAQTTADVGLYIGNGHAAWEAALTNTLRRGDLILTLCTGRFAKGWASVANTMGIETEFMDFGTRGAVNLEELTKRLTQDKDHRIRAVITVQSDTATSVKNDTKAIRQAIDDAKHPALYMVDAICSLGCEPLFMDDWGIDLLVSACQKGLMTPAGLSFVHFGPKALAARETADQVTQNWDILPRLNPELFYQTFNGTAPTHLLFALDEALSMIKEEGLKAIWHRHERLANGVWAAVDTWGKDGDLELNIPNPAERSHAVSTIRTGNGDGDRIRDWCETHAGVTLGIGMPLTFPSRDYGESLFRIGHMGHVNLPMVMGTLGAIDAALKALNIAHGQGALEAATTAMTL